MTEIRCAREISCSATVHMGYVACPGAVAKQGEVLREVQCRYGVSLQLTHPPHRPVPTVIQLRCWMLAVRLLTQ